MFRVNDYVRYGMKGIFKIKDIQKRKNKFNKYQDWYVLSSHTDGVDTTIITPADNPKLRKIISKEEVLDVLDKMPSMELLWEDNKRNREELFHEILLSNDVYKMA